jgi:hypothetical protein
VLFLLAVHFVKLRNSATVYISGSKKPLNIIVMRIHSLIGIVMALLKPRLALALYNRKAFDLSFKRIEIAL